MHCFTKSLKEDMAVGQRHSACLSCSTLLTYSACTSLGAESCMMLSNPLADKEGALCWDAVSYVRRANVEDGFEDVANTETTLYYRALEESQ